MRRRKALTVVLSLVTVFGLALVLVLVSKPTPAVSHPSYTYKPGCHCGAPKTTPTTKKPTAPAAKKPTAPAAKKPATPAAKKPTTTAATSAQGTTTTVSTTSTTVTLGGEALSSTPDLTLMYGSPDESKTMEVASAFVLGLTLAGSAGPPDGSGPAGGSTPGGTAGVSDTGGSAVDPAGTGDPAAVAVGDTAGTGDPAAVGDPAGTGDPAAVDATAAGLPTGPPQYYVSPVAVLFLLVYGATFWCYQTGRIRVATHRKIWNGLLMITFLITGIFGLILVVNLSLNPPLQLPSWLLFWHVETGIVMCFISLFHLGWHARYYARMLVPWRTDRRERTIPSTARRREMGRSQPAFDYVDEARQVRRTDERGPRVR